MSTRLEALQDAYDKLETKTYEFYIQSQNPPASKDDCLNHNDNDQIHEKTSVDDKKEKTLIRNDSSQMQQEDPFQAQMVLFYEQQAKKQKMLNSLPIDEWASLHLQHHLTHNEMENVEFDEGTVRNTKNSDILKYRNIVKQKLIQILQTQMKM